MEQSQRPELIEQLEEIDVRLKAFHDRGIDFKEVVDGLDDSIMITDAEGTVLYINPAYTRNTEITEEDVLNRDVRSLIGKDKLFAGGAVTSVLESGKSAFRLSTTYKTGEPLVGYVVGTPIFKEDGSLRQVVACSRPIVTLSSLQEDFEAFVKEINAIHPKTITTDSDKHLSEGMIGKYGSLKQIDTLLDRVAPTDASVLITGESGGGKEVVADEIYRRSLRKNKPYVKINCASIPGHLLESELFGYEKGAFTGANTKGKVGLFEYANHGTLMLDEIGDMPMDLQVKLLRAIQSQEITRIGGTRPIKLDIRYIASTNCDLKKKVREGTFRSDLYYRLHVIPIQVPPLREREGDVARLSQHFVSEFNKQYHKNVVLSPENIELLENYSWPGNIRELRNVMEYLVVCCAPNGHVDNSYIYGTFDLSNQNAYVEYDPDQSLNDAITAYEKKYLENALRYARNLKEASQILNIDPSTVSRKLRQHGLTLQGK